MSAKVFFDTNVLLDLLSGDPTKAGRAEALLAEGAPSVSRSSTSSPPFAGASSGWSWARSASSSRRSLSVCAVVPVDVPLHEDGVALAYRHNISVYVGLIVAAGLRAGCRALLTEDLNPGQRVEGLVIVNPFTP